nr:hypothetical protein [Tanacetum cinerariifolium]
MYYPRFTKVIIYHFMSKDTSIPRRNKVNWHYVRDDHMFSTIKLVSRHQNAQQFSALLPIELTNEDIRNSNAYQEYYAVFTGVTPPKPKDSVRKTRSSSKTTITPLTAAAGPRLTTSQKGKQGTKASKAKSLSAFSEVAMTEVRQLKLITKRSLQQTHISQAGGFSADKGTGSIPGVLDSSLVSSQFVTSMLNPTLDVGMESIFKTTSQMGAQTPTSVAPLSMSAPTITPSTIATITTTQQAPLPPTTALSNLIQDLPNFGSLFGFDNRMITLEANLSEFMQTNQFAGAVSALPGTIDENMQKIIKEKVKEQVKEQVSKILPRIEQTVNEQLEAEVFARSSNSSKTSYDVAVDLSKIELKKILIEKMEGNKEGKEPESVSAPTKTTTRSAGRSTQGTKSRHASESESATIEEPMHTTFHMEEPSHPEFNIGQQYPHNLLKPLPLIPNNQGHRVIPFDHFINNDLEYLCGGASSRKYTTFVTKTKAADYRHIQ